jgi:hypothetical protein
VLQRDAAAGGVGGHSLDAESDTVCNSCFPSNNQIEPILQLQPFIFPKKELLILTDLHMRLIGACLT